MSNLNKVFQPGRKALIAYVTTGYPDIDATLKAVPLLAENGCDIIELGIPFSDPLADGITIQNASHHALQNGVSIERCLEAAAQLSSRVSTPLVFMTYYNPVLKYQLDKFCEAGQQAGVSGLIIPDLPPEEGEELEIQANLRNIDLIYLLAPNSTPDRIKIVAERSRGFIYLVSLTGVTGARNSLSTDLEEFVTRVRSAASQPLCVGFGISSPEQAVQVAQFADGVIIGSKIIQLMETDPSLASVAEFVKGIRQGLDSASYQ